MVTHDSRRTFHWLVAELWVSYLQILSRCSGEPVQTLKTLLTALNINSVSWASKRKCFFQTTKGCFWFSVCFCDPPPPRAKKHPILRAKPGPTFHWNTSVCHSFLYSSRASFSFSHLSTRPDLPANDCGRAFQKQSFQSSSHRTQAGRGARSHARSPTAGPVAHKWNRCGNRRSPAGKDITFTTGLKVKGQESHRPPGRCCVSTGCPGCPWLQTVLVCRSSLQGATVIKDKVSLAGWGQASDLSIFSLLFLHQANDILIKPTLSLLCWDTVVKTKKRSAVSVKEDVVGGKCSPSLLPSRGP